MTEASIRLLEEFALTGWPALQTSYFDGWVLRFAAGYTRRSNSVSPLYESALDIDEKIDICEGMYRGRGLPVVFKMTAAAQPSGLDEALAGRGYEAAAHTSVQIMPMGDIPAPTHEQVKITDTIDSDWLATFSRMNNVPTQHLPTMEAMISQMTARTAYVSLYQGDVAVSVGLGVVERGYVGFYDIVTDPAFRGQGYGRQLMLHILKWGQVQGAHTANLQVMVNNPPALRLYGGLGFREVYQYWYRVKA